jgi:hypothetical protein
MPATRVQYDALHCGREARLLAVKRRANQHTGHRAVPRHAWDHICRAGTHRELIKYGSNSYVV